MNFSEVLRREIGVMIGMSEYPICPKCHGFIPNNERPGEYPGALSREDNKTEICSECGNKGGVGRPEEQR